MMRRILIPLGHAVLLILLHIFYFNLNWSVPLEYEMMMALNKVESFVGGQGKFDESKYLFVNTAYDISLNRHETEYGDSGTIAITDRAQLASFFDKLAAFGNGHRYILCDILFDKPCADDSALAVSLKKIPRIIVPAQYSNDRHQLVAPVFPVKYAQADYITYEGLVSKIRLFARESATKTLPLVMYEDYNHVSTKVKKFGLVYKSSYIPLSIYPRYFFDRHSMRNQEWRLATVVELLNGNGKLFYDEVIKDRIIVIGNFSDDIHSTFVGSMPGSLVLFNTYLTLQARYHLLGWGWFVFALISFALLCYLEFFYKKEATVRTDKSWKTFFVHIVGVTGWCLLISFLSGIIFRVHITIIPVILYLEIFRHLKKLKVFQKRHL